VSAAPPSRARRRLLRALTVLLGLAAVVLLLGAAELAARALARPRMRAPEMEQFIALQWRYMERCRVAERFVGAPDGPRVVVVGESSASLLGDRLGDVARVGGARFSVANCGQQGSGFGHVRRRFGEALAARPDAIVLVFGHNYGLRYPDGLRELATLDLRYRSRLAGLLEGDRPWPTSRAICDVGVRPAAELADFVREAGAEARAQGTRLVVLTLTANALFPPLCDETRAPDERVARARLRQAEGRLDEARALLAPAVADRSARASFELGTWLAAEGDAAGARAALSAAIVDDRHPGRVTPAVNDALRAAARASGATLLDTAARVAAQQPDGVAGWESLWDHCHLGRGLFFEEALAVLDLLGVATAPLRAGVHVDADEHLTTVLAWLTRDMGGPMVRRRRQSGPLAVALWRLITRDPSLDARVEAWPDRPPALAPDERAFWLGAAAEAHRMAGHPDRARVLSDRALAAAGDVAWVWQWRGLLEVSVGHREEARRAFARAAELDPGLDDARVSLGAL
jgi:tetratricopeptide (TPR) repeat protein